MNKLFIFVGIVLITIASQSLANPNKGNSNWIEKFLHRFAKISSTKMSSGVHLRKFNFSLVKNNQKKEKFKSIMHNKSGNKKSRVPERQSKP